MSKQLQLEPANENDFDFSWKLYSNSVAPIMNNHISDGWNEEKEQKNFLTVWDVTKTFIITLDNQKVGWISGEEKENEVYIENGYITPEYRGQGIGKRILAELKAMFSKKNKHITLSMLNDNPNNKFFNQFDFETIEEEKISKKIKLTN